MSVGVNEYVLIDFLAQSEFIMYLHLMEVGTTFEIKITTLGDHEQIIKVVWSSLSFEHIASYAIFYYNVSTCNFTSKETNCA